MDINRISLLPLREVLPAILIKVLSLICFVNSVCQLELETAIPLASAGPPEN